jgi:hypothetical protein
MSHVRYMAHVWWTIRGGDVSTPREKEKENMGETVTLRNVGQKES